MSIKDIFLRVLVLCIVAVTIWAMVLLADMIFPKREEEPALAKMEQIRYTEIINHQNTVIEKLQYQVDSLNRQLIEINEQKQKLQDGYKNYVGRAKPANLSTLQGYFSKRYSEPASRRSTKGSK